ncbi:MmcQ/YjbR family DNA-binding protein [Flavobacterium aquicola]|uniref:Putative DNA-binding protein (MmcQ/YjbR family) n=1 Tax=Flavobacterium aquicola TaxID=1682742 RepID=A0A3E0EMU7_9FLAO|nr:MmcQ/YjbR family DNA-binding protein [Flavobacterium aquicola]REG99508.1 putative DNA-binding protein (MmcQ/YjbR family) [Flavobacterium aquicola]
MDIEALRTFCLSFPDTHEGMPFAGFFKNSRAILVFYVGKKMFCFFDIDRFDYCTLKCDPEKIEELSDQEGFERPFNLSRKYWINVELQGKVSEEVLKDLVEKSYKLVVAGLQKKPKTK